MTFEFALPIVYTASKLTLQSIRYKNTMLIKKRIVQDIFSDKSSLVVRALREDPKHDWTIPEFARKEKISTGLVMAVFKILQEE